MPRKRKPKLCYHKATGQWYVRISGKIHYLGTDEIEAEDRRRDILADWLRHNADPAKFRLTIDDLCLLFLDHARQHYRKNDQPTSEVQNIKTALRPLVQMFGTSLARDFGPKKLKAVRQAMIDAGCVRTSINRQIGRIKRLFRWGVAEEFIQPDTLTALQAVDGLRAGRSNAEESEPVRPVADEAIHAVHDHVSEQVWAMIQLQLFTGMRPGEVVSMRGCDLNMNGKVWEYVPESHKTEHYGKRRVIYLGPKAQKIIREFLRPQLSAYLFSPADARDSFDAGRRKTRRTPITPSQRARTRKANPRKSPGDHYSVCSYGQSIRNACERAFGMPPALRNIRKTIARMKNTTENEREVEKERLRQEASTWRKLNCWHPHQLRHNAATVIRKEASLDTARAVLGHASTPITEVYAERDAEAARKIIEKIG